MRGSDASCSTVPTTRPGPPRWPQRCALLGARRPAIVFGAMRGKDVSGVLRALAPLQPRLVFTAVDDPKAHAPDELLQAWHRIGPGGERRREPRAALARAAELRHGDEAVVVAGSLYLVGALRGVLHWRARGG